MTRLDHAHRPADERADLDPPLLDRASRWLLTGLGLSLALHAILLSVLAVVILSRPSGDLGPRGVPAEIEVATQSPSAAEDLSDAWLDESLPEPSPEPASVEQPVEVPAATPTVGGVASPSPATDLGGAGVDGAGESVGAAGGAGGAGASFFGVEASGTRFVFIVDVSGSMARSGKIDSLRRELGASIDGLTPASSFAVIAFSDEATTRILGGRREWTPAGDEGRSSVAIEIRGLSPGGGTEPLEAFRIAFALEPKPEAVYFMTDGVFEDANAVVGAIRSLNSRGGRRTPIHCIAFQSRVGAPDLRRIARNSGGTYTFVRGSGGP